MGFLSRVPGSRGAPSCSARCCQPGKARQLGQERQAVPPSYQPSARGAEPYYSLADQKYPQRRREEAGGRLSPRNVHREPQVKESGVPVPENQLVGPHLPIR